MIMSHICQVALNRGDLVVHADDDADGYCENDCPQVEKVVCETEFRPTCTVKLEKDCKNVTRCSSLSLS